MENGKSFIISNFPFLVSHFLYPADLDFDAVLTESPYAAQYKTSPHFSPAFYCGGGSGHVYSVALGRAPRHTIKYACGAF
jgi:hypothetical protein